ncbi:MAG: Gldg family protein [Clostridia bacterium]|nr:Gldg family protein [Clostridia bacterium]
MKNFFKKMKGALTGRGGQSALITALVVLLVVIVNVFLYSLGTALRWYKRYTPTDDLSLMGDTDALFAEAIEDGREITITFCRSEGEMWAHSSGKYVINTARLLQEKYPTLLRLRFVNIITMRDHETEERVDLNKYRTDMNGNETVINSTSVIFSSGDNYRVITDTVSSLGYSDFFGINSSGAVYAYNGEEIISSMMSWVLTDEHRTVYFTKGHGETADVTLTNLISCLGFYVDVIDLSHHSVPEDAAAVVISNPKNDFERAAAGSSIKIKAELERLDEYLLSGGRLLAAFDPYSKRLPKLEAFIAECGIVLSGGTDADGVYCRDIIKDSALSVNTAGTTFVTEPGSGEAAQRLASVVSKYSADKVLVSECSALTLSGGAEALLVSSGSSEATRGDETVSSDGGFATVALADYGEAGGSVCVSSTVLLTTGDVMASSGYANRTFVIALLDELTDAPCTPYGCNIVSTDTTTLQNLTMREAKIYTAVILAVPVLLAVLGAVLIIKRKNA